MKTLNLPMAALLIAGLTVSASAMAQSSKPARADANGDGALSKTEFTSQRVKRLMRLDADGDGKISAAEWSARPMGANAGAQGRDPAKAFARLDANKDGLLDETELARVSDRAYARLDANHDGKLTPAEQKAQMAQRRGSQGK